MKIKLILATLITAVGLLVAIGMPSMRTYHSPILSPQSKAVDIRKDSKYSSYNSSSSSLSNITEVNVGECGPEECPEGFKKVKTDLYYDCIIEEPLEFTSTFSSVLTKFESEETDFGDLSEYIASVECKIECDCDFTLVPTDQCRDKNGNPSGCPTCPDYPFVLVVNWSYHYREFVSYLPKSESGFPEYPTDIDLNNMCAEDWALGKGGTQGACNKICEKHYVPWQNEVSEFTYKAGCVTCSSSSSGPEPTPTASYSSSTTSSSYSATSSSYNTSSSSINSTSGPEPTPTTSYSSSTTSSSYYTTSSSYNTSSSSYP